jgi:hypothetical protein
LIDIVALPTILEKENSVHGLVGSVSVHGLDGPVGTDGHVGGLDGTDGSVSVGTDGHVGGLDAKESVTKIAVENGIVFVDIAIPVVVDTIEMDIGSVTVNPDEMDVIMDTIQSDTQHKMELKNRIVTDTVQIKSTKKRITPTFLGK